MKPLWSWRVWNGMRGAVVGRKKAAEIIACLNALLTWKVQTGDKDVGEVLISDTDTTLLLPKGLGSHGTDGIDSVGLRMCQITELFEEDYIGVKFYDGSSVSGDQFNVAKSVPSRMPPSSTVYSYTYTDDNNRTSTVTGSSPADEEEQTMTQPFVVNDLVFVAYVDFTGVEDTNGELHFIEVNTEREWTAQLPE
jgi:hypothetical protein